MQKKASKKKLKTNQKKRHFFCVVSLLLSVFFSVAVVFFGKQATERLFFKYPIKIVKIVGDFHYLEQQKLKKVLNIYMTDNFFQVDLEKIKNEAEMMPWIEEVWVRKAWPDTVILRLQERKPVASWGTDRLVSERKEIFDAHIKSGKNQLPVLWGADQQAPLMIDRYNQMRNVLSIADLNIAVLELEERFSWRVTLVNGIKLVVDEANCMKKMKAFVALYNNMSDVDRPYIDKVDLRYDNGLAIKWKKKHGGSHAA